MFLLQEGLWLTPYRCSLFGSSLLFFRYTHWHVYGQSTHWWFYASSVGAVCENWVINHITTPKTKSCIVQTINGYHQPRDQKPTQCLGEASANPCCGDWTTHPTKSWAGTKVGPTEGTTSEQSKWRIGWWRTQQQPSPDEQSPRKAQPRWKHLSGQTNAKEHLRN